jgi:hypothetical protein
MCVIDYFTLWTGLTAALPQVAGLPADTKNQSKDYYLSF